MAEPDFAYHARVNHRLMLHGQNYDFSNGYEVVSGVIVADGTGKSILPTHEASGLPLTILGIEPPLSNAETWYDYDHRYYPASCRQLKNWDGLAVRFSSGQDLPRWLHNRKHKVFPEGPKLPVSREEKYNSVLLNILKYVPRQAIDLTRAYDYRVREMSDRQIEELVTSRAIHIDSDNRRRQDKFYRNTIGRFIAQQAVEQEMSHISPKLVDEFLNTPDSRRRVELGNLFLADSVESSVEPIVRKRRELLDQGLVQLSRQDPVTTARKLFIKSRFVEYLPELARRLSGEYESPAA
jgi:hypothetical protein